MSPQEIKDLLKETGWTQSSVADDLGVRQTTVWLVIHGKTTSRRIQDRICEIIQKPFAEVWRQE